MIIRLFEIASSISTPLMLAGFLSAALFIVLLIVIRRLKPDHFTFIPVLRLIISRLFILSLVAIVLGFVSFIIKETDTHPPPPPPTKSIHFTIGYLTKRAIWRVTLPVTAFCLNVKYKRECNTYLNLLDKRRSILDPEGFLKKLDYLIAKETNVPHEFVRELQQKLTRKAVKRNLSEITIKYINSQNWDMEIKQFTKEIEDLYELLLEEAHEIGTPNNYLGLIFLGGQVGEIDEFIHISFSAELPNSQIANGARNRLKLLFIASSYPTFKLSTALDDILEHYPGLVNRIDTITLEELTSFIGRIKEKFLLEEAYLK